MKLLFSFLISSTLLFIDLFANEDSQLSFITDIEYGAMLYKSPRGIGCHKCHANGNKEIIIANYKDKDGNLKALVSPPITKISYEKFVKKLEEKKDSSKIMPTYFLTKKEIKSIYKYVQELSLK